jgi:hypothetical protein
MFFSGSTQPLSVESGFSLAQSGRVTSSHAVSFGQTPYLENLRLVFVIGVRRPKDLLSETCCSLDVFEGLNGRKNTLKLFVLLQHSPISR